MQDPSVIVLLSGAMDEYRDRLAEAERIKDDAIVKIRRFHRAMFLRHCPVIPGDIFNGNRIDRIELIEMQGHYGWVLKGHRKSGNNRIVPAEDLMADGWVDRHEDVQRSDPTRFVDGCQCRIGAVVRDPDIGERIIISGESDCPVHGFGSEE